MSALTCSGHVDPAGRRLVLGTIRYYPGLQKHQQAASFIMPATTVTLALGFSAAVTVARGTPSPFQNTRRYRDLYRWLGHQRADLQLYGGGRAEHRQPAATAVNARLRHCKDGTGNAASRSVTGLTQAGPQIEQMVPACDHPCLVL